MNNPKINAILNLLLAIAFIASALSGFGGRDFREFHYSASVVVVVLVLLHLIIHWRWIRCIPQILKN